MAFALVPALMLCAVLAARPAFGQSSSLSRSATPALFVVQTVAGPDLAAAASLQIRLGLPSGRATSPAASIQRDPAAYPFKGLAPVDFGRAQVRAAIAAQGQSLLAQQWPQLKAGLQALLGTTGAALAHFSYRQQVVAADSASPLYLSFGATVDATGRASASPVRLRSSLPVYLLASYTPLTNGADVAAQWAAPEAGTLRWRPVDAAFVALAADTVVQTGGAYDEPESTDPAQGVSPTAGVECLADHALCIGPPPAAPDLRGLMQAAGADGTWLDYRLRTQADLPADCTAQADSTASCLGSVAGVTVSQRTLGWSLCGAVAAYRATGKAAERLVATTLRFWFDGQAARPAFLAASDRHFTTPQRPFDRTVLLDGAGAVAQALQTLPNPLADQPVLLPVDMLAASLARMPALQTPPAGAATPTLPGLTTIGQPLLPDPADPAAFAPRWTNTFTCLGGASVQYLAQPWLPAGSAATTAGRAPAAFTEVLSWDEYLAVCRQAQLC